MNDEERRFKNTSGLDAHGLCNAYAECGKPFVETGKYMERIDIEEFAQIEQGKRRRRKKTKKSKNALRQRFT